MTDENQQVVMTQAQLQELLAGVVAAASRQQSSSEGVGGVSLMPPCTLGRDKTKRHKAFEDWIKEAEAKMEYLRITEDSRKTSYVKSHAGPELMTFWEKEVRVRFTPVVDDTGETLTAAHTYDEIVQLSKAELLALVCRDRAVIDLLRMSQGDMSAMEFVAAVEDQSHLCQAHTQPVTEEDLVRMALIGGMRDRTLAEKALAENYNLKTTITVMKTRETSKANAVAMRGLAAASEVNRLQTRDLQEANLEEEHETIARLEEELAVMKLRRQGRYSSRGGAGGGRCRNCNLPHDRDEECSAKGRRCYACDGSDHYARAPACPNRNRRPPIRSRRGPVQLTSRGTHPDNFKTLPARQMRPETRRLFTE